MDGLTLALWWICTCIGIIAVCGVVHIVETIVNRIKSGWYNGRI